MPYLTQNSLSRGFNAEKINIQIASTDILLCRDTELLYFKEQINYLKTSISFFPLQNYKTRYYEEVHQEFKEREPTK